MSKVGAAPIGEAARPEARDEQAVAVPEHGCQRQIGDKSLIRNTPSRAKLNTARKTFVGFLRRGIASVLPAGIKWWLVRSLTPAIVDGMARLLQGIDPVFASDSQFMHLYSRVSERCLIDRKKAYVLYNLVRSLNREGGATAEIGVYRGATAKIILEASEYSIPFYGFDTFAGLPETDVNLDPYWSLKDLSADDVDAVAAFLDADQATLISGVFPDTASELPEDIQFQFVHIDCDIYQSTKEACEFFFSRLVKGGIMLIDDYGNLTCPGVRIAVDQFFENQDVKPVFIPSAQALIIKH